ncbi:uroporphyrinogen-III synthase [sulfur-oxidizing endosymbiont of Gigantopelta aegis]|uniref:uroporphyrinogen-III synthase n=1 Tax=sulfur-oxidizing endosymbiont of Gigantopelta aegis TaxID=2794934 RepID=UPI0018DC6F05|nr:uroporphyrinogen-III synthase [sulfur-oxidizing endosymbiont of Gigantopelta aegis]
MTEAHNVDNLLAAARILVTRPAHQAEAFCAMLAKQGAEPICLPLIDIVVTPLKQSEIALLQALDTVSLAIFISPNAVEHGLAALLGQGKIPDTLKLVTIGQASADKMLQLLGRRPDIYPLEQYNSEALLALPALSEEQINGASVLILRGEGGRELLANTLRERGAKVAYVEVYRRQLATAAQPLLRRLFISNDDKNPALDLICLTSNEGLQNLQAMVETLPKAISNQALQCLWQTPLLLVTEKMRDNARQMGFTNTLLMASNATNEAMLESVLEWAKLNDKSS